MAKTITQAQMSTILDDLGLELEPGPNGSKEDAPARTKPVLDDAALYGLPGDVVRAISPHSEADPAALLVLYLAAFGSAVGRGPHAVAESDEHAARLNLVIVGGSSKARKGTAQGRVDDLMRTADPSWVDNHKTSGLSSGEGLIQRVRDGTGDDPGVGDKRLLVVEEEFSRVLAMSARDGSILRDVLRLAWDGKPLRTLTRKDSLTSTNPHISVIGHITVEELTQRLTGLDIANGFANRFLFVYVERSKRLPRSTGELDVRELGQRTRDALTGARVLRRVEWSPEAGEAWDQLYEEMAEDDSAGMVGALVKRDTAQVLRLAVTYALTDRSASIETPHLEAAWAVWRYCRASIAYIFGDLAGDTNYDKLLDAIRQAPGRQLDGREQHKLFSGHIEQGELERLRRKGAERGELKTTEVTSSGGRPLLVTYAMSKGE